MKMMKTSIDVSDGAPMAGYPVSSNPLRSTVDFGTEVVNHPVHYNAGNIEVIDFIEDQKLPYHLGNVVKYVARAAHKGTAEQDLRKAAWYLSRYIEKTFS